MFGIGRSKTRSQLVREELGEGLDHLRQAATHAAEGVGATVGPRVHAAREVVTPAANRARTAAAGSIAAFTPLAMAAAENARQAGKQAGKSSRRMRRNSAKALRKDARALRRVTGREERGMSRNRKLAGLLMIGIAAGAAGSMIMRKRRQRDEEQWTTHESSTARSATDAARQMAENAKERVQSATESAKETVKNATETAKSAMHSSSSDSEPNADRMASSDRLTADPASQTSGIRPAGMAGAGNGAGAKVHGDKIGTQDSWSKG